MSKHVLACGVAMCVIGLCVLMVMINSVEGMGDDTDRYNGTKYVSDALAGNDGKIPILDTQTVPSVSNTRASAREKRKVMDGMNMLEDAGWYSGTLDKEFKGMVSTEKQWTEPTGGTSKPHLAENFGSNRAPEYWNETDYPIISSGGINMTPEFPQVPAPQMDVDDLLHAMWGEPINASV